MYGDGGAWFTAPITSGYVQRGGYGDGGAWFTAPITSGYVQRGGYGASTRSGRSGTAEAVELGLLRRQIRELTAKAQAEGRHVPTWSEPRGVNASRLRAALRNRVEALTAVRSEPLAVAATQAAPGGQAFIAAERASYVPSSPGWVIPTVVGVAAAAALGAATYLVLRSR